MGPKYTWCNNQNGLARRWAKLDCCLVNMWSSSKYSNYTLRHLPRIFSNYAPLLLSINLYNSYKCDLFHFANHWLDYIGCNLAVRIVWTSSLVEPMQAFTHLIARTLSNINACKAIGLNSIDSTINKDEIDIMSLKMSECSNFVDHPQLLKIHAKYAALQRQILTKWVQRTRMLWVSDGDQNNSFFP